MQNITHRTKDGNIVKIQCYTRLNSTVELAREYAERGYPDRYAVMCEYENNKENDEHGLYMSCILRPSIFPAQAGLLTALATAALAEGLELHTRKRIGIGWVNSIYCEGKQIGSVSIEGKLDDFKTYEYIIVSFVAKLSSEDFPNRLTDLMKTVFEADNMSVVTLVAKDVLNKFFPFYITMRSNPKQFMSSYRQKFILNGVKIKYISDGKRESARVVGLNTEICTLKIQRKNGEEIEVSSPTKVVIPKSIRLPSQKRAKQLLEKKEKEATENDQKKDEKETAKAAAK